MADEVKNPLEMELYELTTVDHDKLADGEIVKQQTRIMAVAGGWVVRHDDAPPVFTPWPEEFRPQWYEDKMSAVEEAGDE